MVLIHIARIYRKHGDTLYAGWSEAELLGKIASYCRDNWDRLDEEIDLTTMPDQQAIDTYFAAENLGEHEYVEIQTDELPTPTVVANLSGGVLQGASATHPVELITLDFEDVVIGEENHVVIDGSDAVRGGCSIKIDPDWVRGVAEA